MKGRLLHIVPKLYFAAKTCKDLRYPKQSKVGFREIDGVNNGAHWVPPPGWKSRKTEEVPIWGLCRCQPWGKEVLGPGSEGGNCTWEVTCQDLQDRKVYSNFVGPYPDITLRASWQTVCYSTLFIYTGACRHRGRDDCNLNNNLGIITHPSHSRSSIILSRTVAAITHRPIHRIISVCIRFPQMNGPTVQHYIAEISGPSAIARQLGKLVSRTAPLTEQPRSVRCRTERPLYDGSYRQTVVQRVTLDEYD